MAEIVSMPRLSDTMVEGTVAKWHKQIGDKVNEGDLLAEIETDKATMDFEAFQEGVLLHIGVDEGQTAPVDSILAVLGEKNEDISAVLASGASAEATKSEPEVESAPQKKEDKSTDKSTASSGSGGNQQRLKASPLAKKMAADKGIDIAAIAGTGEGGRVVKRDIDNYTPKSNSSDVNTAAGVESYEEVPVSQMRKTIAKRLGESKFTAPHFYLTMDIDMDAAIEGRKSINAVSEKKVSFNDMVIKATALALEKNPKVNSSWLGDKIRYNHHVNIGVAVAVDEGLLVPVVRNANNKGLATINAEVKEYAGKARDKKLVPADWEGNTFTISNLGMFGIEEFTAIINSPDSCILAVGAIKQVPVIKNGAVVAGNVMRVTLSCDHRVVDGATGSAFLQSLKQYLESPMSMLI